MQRLRDDNLDEMEYEICGLEKQLNVHIDITSQQHAFYHLNFIYIQQLFFSLFILQILIDAWAHKNTFNCL